MTYVLTSGWTSLAFELMQPIALLCYWLDKCFFRGRGVLCCLPQTFPYHTELPRLLLFGLLGFTSSITAPLILPFLMVYFFLAYLVYRNQVSSLNTINQDYYLFIMLYFLHPNSNEAGYSFCCPQKNEVGKNIDAEPNLNK